MAGSWTGNRGGFWIDFDPPAAPLEGMLWLDLNNSVTKIYLFSTWIPLSMTGSLVDAILNATGSPNETNPFIALEQFSTELAGKAALSHTHIISNITSLQTALDGKSAVGHVHAGADISSGTVSTSRFNNGTGASSSTWLRGDGTWVAPAILLRLTGNINNSTQNFADITGLTFAVSSGQTIHFEANLAYTAAATTTALQVSCNGPTNSALDYGVLIATGATAIHSSVQTAYDTVTNPASSGGATALICRVCGSAVFTANGTFAMRLRSEINASQVSVLRGSTLRAWIQ